MSPPLKGINTFVRRGPDGKVIATYFYAWKGGPRLPGKPGSREFKAAYEAAHRQAKVRTGDDLASLALRYQASPEYEGLADGTRKEWGRYIGLICADGAELDVGGIPIAALDDPRVKEDLLKWRNQWRDTPRKADYAMQVLSRVLSHGRQLGLLATNVAIGLGQLYHNNRADQIWTPEELQAYIAASTSPEISFVPQLACLTGLRLRDLNTLSWAEVGDDAIVKTTAKGRGQRVAVVPLLNETRNLLAQIRHQQLARHEELVVQATRSGRPLPTLPESVLSNTLGRPWAYSGLETRVGDTKEAAEPPVEKHLHDARGTFATRLRRAGLTAPEIADVLGWDEDRVERLLAIYVDRKSIVMGIAERIQRLEAEAALSAKVESTPAAGFEELDAAVRRQIGAADNVHHVDFRSRPQPMRRHRSSERTPGHIETKIGDSQNEEREKMKWPLIGLCAVVGDQGVERRSPWITDEWLGAELGRDPYLFREVEFEPGYYELPPVGDAVRWSIPEPVRAEMARQLKAAYPS